MSNTLFVTITSQDAYTFAEWDKFNSTVTITENKTQLQINPHCLRRLHLQLRAVLVSSRNSGFIPGFTT